MVEKDNLSGHLRASGGDPDFCRRLARISVAGWPAQETRWFGRWLVRLDAGVTGRANSVLPLGMPPHDRLGDAIGEVEAVYRTHGLRPMFQMFGAAMPDGLDRALGERGYGHTRRSAFLVGDPRSIPVSEREDVLVVLQDSVTRDWMVVGGGDLDDRELAARSAIYGRILAPRAFALLQVAGAAVAVGHCAVADGWGWFQGMHVVPALRGRGLAGVVLGELAAWAQKAGAERLFIQLLQDNAPALRTYEKAGFRRSFDYWYRVGWV